MIDKSSGLFTSQATTGFHQRERGLLLISGEKVGIFVHGGLTRRGEETVTQSAPPSNIIHGNADEASVGIADAIAPRPLLGPLHLHMIIAKMQGPKIWPKRNCIRHSWPDDSPDAPPERSLWQLSSTGFLRISADNRSSFHRRAGEDCQENPSRLARTREPPSNAATI